MCLWSAFSLANVYNTYRLVFFIVQMSYFLKLPIHLRNTKWNIGISSVSWHQHSRSNGASRLLHGKGSWHPVKSTSTRGDISMDLIRPAVIYKSSIPFRSSYHNKHSDVGNISLDCVGDISVDHELIADELFKITSLVSRRTLQKRADYDFVLFMKSKCLLVLLFMLFCFITAASVVKTIVSTCTMWRDYGHYQLCSIHSLFDNASNVISSIGWRPFVKLWAN